MNRQNTLPCRFGVWRILFAANILFYTLWEFPYRLDFFSNTSPHAPAQYQFFSPELFKWFYSSVWNDQWVTFLFASEIGLALLLLLGIQRQAVCLALFLSRFLLDNAHPFHDPPDKNLINWLLLAMIFIPAGEALQLRKKMQTDWKIPSVFTRGCLLVAAAGYTFSAFSKLGLGSFEGTWADGSALFYVLTAHDLPRVWCQQAIEHFFTAGYEPAFRMITGFFTYMVLAGEAFSFVAFFSRTFLIVWSAWMIFIHLAIIATLSLTQVSIGMIIVHLFFLLDMDGMFGRGSAARPAPN